MYRSTLLQNTRAAELLLMSATRPPPGCRASRALGSWCSAGISAAAITVILAIGGSGPWMGRQCEPELLNTSM